MTDRIDLDLEGEPGQKPRHRVRAARFPVRSYVYEGEKGTAHIDYYKVSPILGRFGGEEANKVTRRLDRMLEELAKGALEVATPERGSDAVNARLHNAE